MHKVLILQYTKILYNYSIRLIIEPDYKSVSEWVACYVAHRINSSMATPEKPFVLGCPTGS